MAMPRFDTFHHLSVFNASIAQNSVDAVLAPVPDTTFNIRNNRLVIPEDRRILAAYSQQDSPLITKFDTATLALGGRPIVSPFVSGVAVPTLAAVDHSRDNPPVMPANEDFGVLVTRAGAGATNSTVAIWHTGMFKEFNGSRSKTVRGTATIIAVAGAWALGQINLDSVLAVGRYTVIGMRAIGAALFAARLVIVGCPERPGVLGDTALANFQLPGFRDGAMGVLGTFDSLNIPQVEVFSNTGGATSYEFHLDLVGPTSF